jgi:hypothetical protein
MIHYVVAQGSPQAVARLCPELPVSITQTEFFAGDPVQQEGRSGCWALAALTAPDPVSLERLAVDGDTFAVINGPALAREGNQNQLVQHAMQAFRRGGTDAVARTVGGAYNFVGHDPLLGLQAFTDFSGLYPLYWYAGRDYVVVSNRSTTIAHLVGSDGWDMHALGWLIGRANLIGDDMPALGVSYLVPGQQLCTKIAGRVEFKRSPTWVWPVPHDHAGRDNLTSAEWDEVTNSLIANFRSLKSFTRPLVLFLTGGKDSRLCLALAKAAGLRAELTSVTTGSDDSPEVACARMVADAAGFRHERAGMRATAASTTGSIASFDPARAWHRISQHSYRYEAILSPWDGTIDAGRATLSIKGFGGELYRRSNAKWFRQHEVATVDAMVRQLIRVKEAWDPFGLLTHEEATFQATWLQCWVERSADVVRLDALPEKFYTDYRLGHWNGPMEQARPGKVKITPLLFPYAAAKNLELSALARGSERFHYEVMSRAAPELVGIPFLNDAWSDVIATPPHSSLRPAVSPAKLRRTPRPLRAWQWHFLESETKAIDRLFRDAAKTDMPAICNMKRLRAAAKKPKRLQTIPEAISILTAVGVALALLGRSEPVLDQPYPELHGDLVR